MLARCPVVRSFTIGSLRLCGVRCRAAMFMICMQTLSSGRSRLGSTWGSTRRSLCGMGALCISHMPRRWRTPRQFRMRFAKGLMRTRPCALASGMIALTIYLSMIAWFFLAVRWRRIHYMRLASIGRSVTILNLGSMGPSLINRPQRWRNLHVPFGCKCSGRCLGSSGFLFQAKQG